MEYDAVVVGSGPNGLAAAITLAREGCKVLLMEAKETVGGGMRTAELTLPGFYHDVCSSVHPLGLASPFFRNLPLEQYGVEWVFPSAPLAHPLADGTAVIVERSVEATADQLGGDRAAYLRLMTLLVKQHKKILSEFLGPLRAPHYPLVMALFGLLALQPAHGLACFSATRERGRSSRGWQPTPLCRWSVRLLLPSV